MLMRTRLAALAIAALSWLPVASNAASTINPNVPATGAPLNSAVMRDNFAAAATDINNILSQFAGPTQPATPTTFQSWMSTSGCPTACVSSIWDGITWVQVGILNQNTHSYTVALTASNFVAADPITISVAAGTATVGIAYNSSLSLTGSSLRINPAFTNTFTARQVVNFNASAAPTPPTGTGLQIVGLDATNGGYSVSTFGTGATAFLSFRYARGTGASPTVIQSGDILGSLRYNGYDGGAYSNAAAQIVASVPASWSGSSYPTQIDFYTTPVASTSAVLRWSIASTGGFFSNGATGGDKGTGTINAGGLVYSAGNALAASATSPLVLNATTGLMTCPTCATSSGGGAITGTAPIAVSGAGVVSLNANGVTYALFQTVAASSLVGNPTGSLATAQGITLGATLAFSGTALQTGAGTGDVSWLANTFSTVLATINANVGTFGSATQAGTFTVNAKGLITAASNVTVTPAITSVTGWGTGVLAAMQIAVGSAGAPVLINGAGGTPSSLVGTNITGTAAGLTAGTANAVAAANITGTTLASNVVTSSLTTLGTITSLTATTINAFTLGGTISGGGNQINNVVIGTSTPLAGSFTTVSASTSMTSPLRIGGAAVGSTLTLESTSGVGTTDFISLATGSQVERMRIFGGSAGGIVGVGTNLSGISGARFFVNQNTASVAVATVGGLMPLLALISADSASAPGGISMYSFGQGPQYNMLMAGGTGATPAATTSGTNGAYVWQGYSGSAYRTGALLRGIATELWSGTASGMAVDVFTTPNTTASSVQAARFQPSGALSIGTTTDPGIGAILANTSIAATTTLKSGGYTVSTLPTPQSAGRRAYVTDQLTVCAAAGAALTGGGAVTCPVFDNGTAWVGG